MDMIVNLLQYVLHIDRYLIAFVSTYGAWTYAALFLIIFCETGLVVTPFLPGDSLLFAAGSIAANTGGALSIQLLMLALILASILGNKLNYLIGKSIGQTLSSGRLSWLLNKKHLEKTHAFYEKHGGKTIIFARFIPIIRTFAPFVAGMGRMSIQRFSVYNVFSGILWVGCLLSAGYFLGTIPFVKENFTLFIYGIILVSLMPAVATLLYHRLSASKTAS